MLESNDKSAGLSFKDLIIQLKSIKSQSFSGNLIVKVDANLTWTFSFRLGRLGWFSGGVDSINCWQRSLSLAKLKLSPEKLAEINNLSQATLESNTLAELLVKESIDREKCADIVTRMTIEGLFDIIQFSQHSGNRLAYRLTETGAGNSSLNLILPLLEIEPILTKSIQVWQEWANAGLALYAPSLFPVIYKSTEISQLLDGSDLYHTVLSIDGNRSLRSLAANNHQSILEFTNTLLPLFRSGFITLAAQPKSRLNKSQNAETIDRSATGDLRSTGSSQLSNRFNQPANSASIENSATKQSPLIACIDDSILIYQSLERILDRHGYRHYGIQDPLKIMPSLIRNKPDFIFLDLLMPITNGYEVCEQIRKTPSLKHIPVIILTGKDGLIDRMRSKMVGATGFLGKPVEAEAVSKMLEKYLVVGKES
ncbi:response regulator [Chamaesiphon sp. VAR_48_metabat_135_sub]|uniref:response regulator n=1 Tax=Chamaesiphon sp. VAR_48_metabat_135_sub TaxID=2964699 RepID=UPI00286D4460|nr:response regulator [Chamaesiphon sp. VAR_48_metabat_135_sub]